MCKAYVPGKLLFELLICCQEQPHYLTSAIYSVVNTKRDSVVLLLLEIKEKTVHLSVLQGCRLVVLSTAVSPIENFTFTASRSIKGFQVVLEHLAPPAGLFSVLDT